MDAKVVRITMIPKGFTQSKKGAYPVYKAGYWLTYLLLRLYMNRIKYVSFCRVHNKTYVNVV